MAYIYFEDEIHVDVNDMFESMSEKEKKEMLVLLCEEFKVNVPNIGLKEKLSSIIEEDIDNACYKISQKYFVLSQEEIDTIVKISQKL